jgi:hypothetical protein
MSSRPGGTSKRAAKRPIVVVAGESANDREVLRCFLEAFCPQMQGRIVFLNGKVPLRDASETTLKERVRRFTLLVRAKAARERAPVAAVFLHEDLDDVDSERYDSVRERVQRALARELENAHYVLAVWEIEAWLLLFPEEVAGFTTGWRVSTKRRGGDTGKFQDPKRIFKEEISKAGVRYRESDAPAIANHIVAHDKHTTPIGGNRSYEAFRTDATDRCQKLSDSRTC